MSILTHVTVGTNDIAAARTFYDPVLGALGYKRLFDFDDRSGYGATAPQFLVIQPIDGKPAAAGNGVTVGLAAANRAAVDAFHKAAMAQGGSDAGAPGPRPFAPTAYAAYIRDPLGNKIAAITMSAD